MDPLTDRIVDALTAYNRILRPAIRQLMAEAWQEGRQAGHDHMVGKSASNPYTETEN